MILEDDHIVLAAEYVLGTLDVYEVATVEQLLASEPDFVALVHEWERRLGELSAMVAPVEPPADLIEKIRAQLSQVAQATLMHLPDMAAVRDPRVRLNAAPQFEMPRPAGGGRPLDIAPGDSISALQSADQTAQISQLSQRARRWRSAGTAFAALAAALAAVFVTSVTRPDLMPAQLRPKAQTVEVVKTVEKAAEKPSRFVAVLQRDAVSPAFILTVDLDNRSMTVRRVAAETPVGKSYELWLVSDKYPQPRSLGVVGSSEFTAAPTLTTYPSETISDATYAITLEPEGGSPTGNATGPILWTGKLIEATPPDAKP